MLSHTLLPILLFGLSATALPVTKASLDQRAPQDYTSSPFPDTILTPKYDQSKYGGQSSGSISDSYSSETDDGNTNVASSFSPSIQESPFANDNTLYLGRLVQFRKRQDNTNVASSFSPSIQESDFLNGNIIHIREAEADSEVPEKRQDNINVASSFSPSIQDSPFLKNNNIDIAGQDGAENANCQSGDGADSGGNTIVASSFSPGIQDSPFLNCNSINVLSGKK